MIAKKIGSHRISIQIISRAKKIPSRYYLTRWTYCALSQLKKPTSLTIRIVDEKESTQLNNIYRHKINPTNVLSFPFTPPAGIKFNYLGDIIICAPVILKEAIAQDKFWLAHWAHMVIHGTLHLLGYDHIKKSQAIVMEKREKKLLAQLGYPNPYE